MNDPLTLEAHGLRYRVHPDVYDPSDDTWLLVDLVRRLGPGRMLEVGTGAGLVAAAAAVAGHLVVATDVNPHALRLARVNARLNAARVRFVRADLLRGVRAHRFDAIVCNPPYLPTAPEDHVPGPVDLAFDGGPDGLGVTRRLLGALPRDAPDVYLVSSSLQAAHGFEALVASTGRRAAVVAERPLAHERLRLVHLEAPKTKA